ncbi:PadR family transcriptional regulator [Weissella paramesenteroides]|jgi:PadR family transcriptional regulator PadR|uniref:Transcriptional regulator, PadR family n=2 Tax=Weissella paramesenteroides TaxID=1249 RepID=C5RD83_WEIPA|nr:PadR family transcriptional regulator [Weissella paramesenteroides]ATF41965.1 PadR family transcriptional regulator [Weissella paramesenteroides]EER73890.1 transcriptional regulator, PadR family [Weissella paramesenteroides ATCC 33313]KAA8440312.1 PadR family transcriptional regulator [Weissella paramesenteroides]KAA8440592.1 PadR family transcriptional regulator [Weissella paramesenteroides]KAA8440687.1 PadR family transcriptional regulator [Weissella paramesenteroides]
MTMQLSSDLMDGLVLALLSKEDLYGYSLTKQVQERFAVSESTMYPVLRRLKKRDWVTTYDEPFEGRNRRYYSISDLGYKEMTRIQDEWRDFSRKINDLMLEGDANGK